MGQNVLFHFNNIAHLSFNVRIRMRLINTTNIIRLPLHPHHCSDYW